MVPLTIVKKQPTKILIVTDSNYVFEGATKNLYEWIVEGNVASDVDNAKLIMIVALELMLKTRRVKVCKVRSHTG